jgi:hypothetical protein
MPPDSTVRRRAPDGKRLCGIDGKEYAHPISPRRVGMEKQALRPLVFDALRRTPQTHVHAIETEIRQRAEGYERGDALLVQEVVWELLLQGVLAPGKNSLNLHLPFVHVTEFGQKCLDEGAIAAYDPDGYVARLRSETEERISGDVLESARDALLSFHRGLFRASLILLSRAAAQVFGEVRHAEDHASSATLPTEEAEQGLAELEALARLAHSAAGDPRVPVTDRESTLGRLLLFPAQCRFAYTLIADRRGMGHKHAP